MRAAYLLPIFRARNWRYQISLVVPSNSSSARGLMMSLMVSGRWRPRNAVCSATRDCWRQWRTAGLSQTLPRERIRRNQLRSRARTGATRISGVREASRLGAREVDPASDAGLQLHRAARESHTPATRPESSSVTGLQRAGPTGAKQASGRTVAASQEIVNLLAESDEYETRRIEQVKQHLWLVGDVLPLDLGVLRSAAECQADYDLSPQDAIVYASIRARLEVEHASGSCFVSRNPRYFNDSDLQRDLKSFNCKYFSSFVTGLQYIEHAITSPPGS
jgi:hypothetical protein